MLAVLDPVLERPDRRARDLDVVAPLVGESAAGLLPVDRRHVHRAEEQHEAVRVLVVAAGGRLHQVKRVARDLAEHVRARRLEAVGAADATRDALLHERVEREGLVEQSDPGPDGTAGGVVLGLAEEERAAPLEVAQVDVVADGGAHHAPVAGDGEHDLRLRVVPRRVASDANQLTGAHGCEHGRLGEDLGVRAEPHLQVLGPEPLGAKAIGKGLGRRAARAHVTERSAQACDESFTQVRGHRRVPPRALLDHSLEQACGEGHARGLDHLEIDGRQQVGTIRLTALVVRGIDQILHGPQLSKAAVTDDGQQIRPVEQVG